VRRLQEKVLRSSVDVHNFLLDDDVPHELSALPGPLRDLADAPEVLGLPPAAVARPVLLADADGAVVVLAPATAELDRPGIGALLRRPDLEPVDADRSPDLTGYLLPFVPPVGLACDADVLIDEQVAEQDVVYTAAGEPGKLLKVRACDLVKATNALVFRVTRSG
jgi:prolyl-tRNA editing enzyme YbaK/EbsC (Cys-tRNA(Pro) deacylase)